MTEAGENQSAWRKLAASLCRNASLPEPVSMRGLAGGKNNRVLRVELADGRTVVLKKYHHDPRDGRDRLGAEWSFLRYASDRGVTTVPTALAHDEPRHAGLYSFVEGAKAKPGTINNFYVAQAIAFVMKLNGPPRDVMALAPASEACFSLDAHIATVDRRVARLASLDPEAPYINIAAGIVREHLEPHWKKVRDALVRRASAEGLSLSTELTPEEMCISPSDFGFHNALVGAKEGLTFIDFEYAGRDDPAKLVSDFFCQPEVPVPVEFHAGFIEAMMRTLGLAEVHRARCALLLDAYRIKWACIMLNDFLPVDAARRSFATGGDRAQRCAAQIGKAQAALAQLGAL